MTAQGEDILAWLDAAITRREASARRTADEYGAEWVADEQMQGVSSDTGADVLDEPGAPYAYIAEHDPASVLRRCAADRKLMLEHAQASLPNGIDLEECRVCGGMNETWPCPTLYILAEGYGWAEGER